MSDPNTKKLALLGLASLCRAAADRHLFKEEGFSTGMDSYSCCAVLFAGTASGVEGYSPASRILRAQGVGPFGAFSDIPAGPERQYARALWLTMLATAIEAGDMDPADFGLK